MQIKGLVFAGLAALVVSLPCSQVAVAQFRDRDTRAAPDERRRPAEREKAQPRRAPEGREMQRDRRPQRQQAQPMPPSRRAAPRQEMERRAQPPRRVYNRPPQQQWHRAQPAPQRRIYVPHRWERVERPHHRALRHRHYSRVWWCGTSCRIALLFGFTVWTVDTVVSSGSVYSFPVWEALEYNRTGETSLWESGWGYVEFTPTRTFQMRFGPHLRDCRDFLRVVVRNDGLERRYRGTACRNPDGAWWIVS